MKISVFSLLMLISPMIFSDELLEHVVPPDFTDVASLIADAQVHMAYLGSHNFVGRQIEGYQANICYLQDKAAHALVNAQRAAADKGLTLWIYDCYRPQRAVNHFMRWASDANDIRSKSEYYPNVDKNALVGDYIAEKSGHSRGSTIDLTLARRDEHGEWQVLDMGSPFDMFDPISNVGHLGINQLQQANRKLLERIMLEAGFTVYSMEWWHFTHQPPVYTETYFDFIVR